MHNEGTKLPLGERVSRHVPLPPSMQPLCLVISPNPFCFPLLPMPPHCRLRLHVAAGNTMQQQAVTCARLFKEMRVEVLNATRRAAQVHVPCQVVMVAGVPQLRIGATADKQGGGLVKAGRGRCTVSGKGRGGEQATRTHGGQGEAHARSCSPCCPRTTHARAQAQLTLGSECGAAEPPWLEPAGSCPAAAVATAGCWTAPGGAGLVGAPSGAAPCTPGMAVLAMAALFSVGRGGACW